MPWSRPASRLARRSGTLAGGLIVATLAGGAMFIVFGLATLIWLVPWRRVVRQLAEMAARRPSADGAGRR